MPPSTETSTPTPTGMAAASNREVPSTGPTTEARSKTKSPRVKGQGREHPVLGPSDRIGEGDSRIVYNALNNIAPPTSAADTEGSRNLFTTVRAQVHWQKMYHATGEVPRLVCVQGDIDPADGSMPVYRHPSDQSPPLFPFSPSVKDIKLEVEKIVNHPMNHVLIQLYRNGNDYISEHSDKTLDIVRGSTIVNVSLGAHRTMRLRTKRTANFVASGNGETPLLPQRKTQLIPMPHESVFVLGLESNMKWLHSINADKRPAGERLDAEKAFGGERISLTFRHIGTFLSRDSSLIWGQGATGKSKHEGQPTMSGDENASQEMINAFGWENQQTEFDWNATYGHGFDVLHFRTPSK